MGNVSSVHGRPAEERTGAQKTVHRGQNMYIGGRKVQKIWVPRHLRCKTDSADRSDQCGGSNDMVGTSKTNLDTRNTRRPETEELSESESSDDDDEGERESSTARLSKDLMLSDTDEETDKEMKVPDEYFSRSESSSSSSEGSSSESTSKSNLSSSSDFLELSSIPTDVGTHALGRRFEYKEYFYPCGAPKGIRTAFAFFCQEFLSTNRKRPEGQGHRNHLLEASEAWKKLPKDRADFFKTKERNDIKRFEEEKDEYEKTLNIKLAVVMERELSKLRSKNKKMQLLQFILAEFPYANKKFARKSTLEVQLMLLRFFNHSMQKNKKEHPIKTQKMKISGKAKPVSVQSKPASKKDSRKPGTVSSKTSTGSSRPSQESRIRGPGSCKQGTLSGKQGPVSDKLKQVSGMANASIFFPTQGPESMKLGAVSLNSGKRSAKPDPASGKLKSNRPGPKSRKSGQKSSKPSPVNLRQGLEKLNQKEIQGNLDQN